MRIHEILAISFATQFDFSFFAGLLEKKGCEGTGEGEVSPPQYTPPPYSPHPPPQKTTTPQQLHNPTPDT